MMARIARFRPSVRALMGLVLVCGLMLGAVSIFVESYRREWLAEQRALVEIRAELSVVGWASFKVGPEWLQTLAGRPRARYFDRITHFFVSMPEDGKTAPLEPRNDQVFARHRPAFKHLERRAWEWMDLPPDMFQTTKP